MEECFRRYDTVTQIYNASGQVPIPENCNGYTVTNSGGSNVIVDNIMLYAGTVGSVQGDSFSTGGNRNEILARNYITVQFQAAVTPAITVTFKVYS